MGHFGGEAGAALVFLIGYILIFIWMTYAYVTGLFKWRSRYSLLYFHVTIRVASQASGVAWGILSWSNISVFLAYLILGAEGYFTLVLCAFRFLISWHQHNLPSHESWLEPRDRVTEDNPNARRNRILLMIFLGPFAVFAYWRNPMMVAHTFLILANTAIVTGGSYLAGIDLSQPDNVQKRLRISKALRTSGQAVFLTCNALLIFAIFATIIGERRRGSKRTHPTLILLAIAWVPLIIRGIFGILQASVWSLSYYNTANYGANGFTPRFLALEYVLGVLTEWLACLILNLTFFTSKGDPTKGDIAELDKLRKQKEVEGAPSPGSDSGSARVNGGA